MSAYDFASLSAHIGHRTVVTTYGGKEVANVAIECRTCGEILLDYNNPAHEEPEEEITEITEVYGILVIDNSDQPASLYEFMAPTKETAERRLVEAARDYARLPDEQRDDGEQYPDITWATLALHLLDPQGKHSYLLAKHGLRVPDLLAVTMDQRWADYVFTYAEREAIWQEQEAEEQDFS